MGEICDGRKSIIMSMGTKVDEKEADLALLETLESGSEFYLSFNKSN